VSEQVDWYARLMEINDISGRIAKVLQSDDVQAKRKILSALGTNLIWDDEKLIIINKKEVQALIDGMKNIKSIYPKFEPSLSVDMQGLNEKTDLLQPVFSIMLPTYLLYRTCEVVSFYTINNFEDH